MKFFTQMPNSVKGALLIICGGIILFNTLGISTQIMRTIVLIGSICLILWGIYLANIHTYIYKLLTEKDERPPQP